ncbi:hypothetical protein PS619_00456 [Pseudomonas fluorescens]|nr:hypothetical protein PS619_00456 [Pseudomonas fluorescens]
MDYSKIRGKEFSQQQSFEELVCQLAKLDTQEVSARFRRVDGSGGDGGVEAYWLLDDGSKVGYQAKYFLRSRDIGWAQIDKSVEQALKCHPELKTYVVAIACDLTDVGETGNKSPRKGGRQHWENHKQVWEKQRSDTGMPAVDFILWSASDLNIQLLKPIAEGLRYYWFNEAEFSSAWFKQQVDLATTSLDERYHSQDHVEVRIERLFKVMLRDDEIKAELESALAAIAQARNLTRSLGALPDNEIRIHLSNVKTHVASLSALTENLGAPASCPWFDGSYEDTLSAALQCLQSMKTWSWNYSKFITNLDQDLERDLEYFHHAIFHLDQAVSNLQKILSNPHFKAEQQGVALLKGRAGVGKSHLLGTMADKAVADGRPVILVLGHLLTDQELWSQMTHRLGLGSLPPDAFLQAFDAASQAARERGLFLVDAINEGVGSHFWHKEISAFLRRLSQFSNIAVVISCRTEYMPYAVPESVREQVPIFEIRGFDTYPEQVNAARVYMSRQGLSQPSIPWMAAEFVNPLFLRSACLALKREGLTQFPKGLKGTWKIFKFYLSSVAKHLGVGRDGGDELVGPTWKSLLLIARQMVTNRRDYVSRAEAVNIVRGQFSEFPQPTNQSWFEVLHRNGLLRLDPDPDSLDEAEEDDIDLPLDEIVRFSFQRFQDHMMAAALLEEVKDIREALEVGNLAFIHQARRINSMWMGLVEALSIQIPERFSVEFLDALPPAQGKWRPIGSLSRLFVQSLRWRSKEAFSERTRVLFNSLLTRDPEYFDVIIELAVVPDHPWNAQALHTKLMSQSLADRDVSWSVHINRCSTDAGGALDKLFKWCLLEQSANTDPEVQSLCGIVLTWLFTSSNRLVRDIATKALASLLIARPDLYRNLCEAFAGLDDVYVLERLHAAAYGACCNDPNTDRLQSFASTAYLYVFDTADTPLSLLLRDYARGIVELAVSQSCLATSVALAKCQPPYRSAPPQLNVTQTMLERAVARAGHNEIEMACTGVLGTFGSYEIVPVIKRFLSAPMHSSAGGADSSHSLVIEHKAAQRWIAKRAYDLGWTLEKFPPDESEEVEYSRDRPVVERIAEKYQWLALNELLCRLADNHKLDMQPGPEMYRTPADIGFQRDIDPTLLNIDGAGDMRSDDWAFDPPLAFNHDEEKDVLQWPVRDNPAELLPELVCRTDRDGKKWWVMYERRVLSNLDDKYEAPEQGLRQQEFRRILPVIVKDKDRRQFVELFCKSGAVDDARWRAPTRDSTAYLREVSWRTTWCQQQWLRHQFPGGETVEYALPTCGYHWEHDLDLSVPHGVYARPPAPWLARELALVPLRNDHCTYVDLEGEALFVNGHRFRGDNYALCEQAFFQGYLARNELQCLWIFVGERSVWPDGKDTCTVQRRYEGILWHDKGGNSVFKAWQSD